MSPMSPTSSSPPRPRVVIFTTYFHPVIGGVESNARRLATFLERQGFPIVVLTKRIDGTLPDREDVDGVEVRRIGPRGERSGAGKWKLIPAATNWLVRHRDQYEVVCCVDYRGIGMAAIAARVITGRRVVVQGQTPGVLGPGFLKGVAAMVYKRADAFACIGHELEREAVAAGVPADRVHYLPNAVDMQRFRPADLVERSLIRRGLGIEPDQLVVVFVGRLSREKGAMELLEAWQRLQPVDATLIVAGPDMTDHPWDVGPAARAYAEEHKLTNVRFTGPTTDPVPFYQMADVAVQPSHFEALGLSAVEALACGVPVVASAVGGLLDFIVDGKNGRLCPPQDADALAECLRPLLADARYRIGLASHARASVQDVFDERVVFGRFGDLLTRLAEQS